MYRLFRYILTTAISVFMLYGVWLLFRCFVSDYFTIPTGSMEPILKPGDRVVVNKLLAGARIYTDFNFNPKGGELKSRRTKGLRSVRHNDVVVFNFPHHDWKISFVINNVYCKRIVAVPGDSLSIVDGHYVNSNYEGGYWEWKRHRTGWKKLPTRCCGLLPWLQFLLTNTFCGTYIVSVPCTCHAKAT